MAIQTVTQRNTLATAYGAAATHAAVYTTTPGASAGTEPSGGSPAYVRPAIGWGAASGGVIAGSPVVNVPAGTSVVGAGAHAGATGPYLDGVTVPTQAFSSQGSYTLAVSYTQT